MATGKRNEYSGHPPPPPPQSEVEYWVRLNTLYIPQCELFCASY